MIGGSCTSGCGRLLWIVGFQLKAFSGADAYYVANNTEYVDALKAAILSAQKAAPSLVPVVVLTGPRSQEELSLKKWLFYHGSIGVKHNLSFQHDMDLLRQDPRWEFSQFILGSWLRVDLPNVLASIDKAKKLPNMSRTLRRKLETVDKDYVLWTDPDVLFRGSITSCTLARPQVLSIGPELRMGWPENYGVIFFNVSGYTDSFQGLIDWGRQHHFQYDHDQNLFLEYWGTAVDVLPNGMNWKPYWGDSSTAIPGPVSHEVIKIVHFHGPKLNTAICFFNCLVSSDNSNDKCATIERLRDCGLKEGVSRDAVWLELLADILIQAYKKDGGQFYRELSQERETYLEAE